MIGCMNHTTLYTMIVKRPQTKVKYFVLVFLTKSFMPTSPPIQSPTINIKFIYNDFTLIGNNTQKVAP